MLLVLMRSPLVPKADHPCASRERTVLRGPDVGPTRHASGSTGRSSDSPVRTCGRPSASSCHRSVRRGVATPARDHRSRRSRSRTPSRARRCLEAQGAADQRASRYCFSRKGALAGLRAGVSPAGGSGTRGSTPPSASRAARWCPGTSAPRRRFAYTVVGDPVEEAARLTELAKQPDERLLACGDTVDAGGGARRAVGGRGGGDPARARVPDADRGLRG